MPYDGLLIHEVEVRRRSGQQDRFGQPVEPRTDRFADSVYSGRLSGLSGAERFAERSHDTVVESAKIFLEPGADVAESDTVTVRDPRTGKVLLERGDLTEVRIVDDSVGPHHIEAKVTNMRSGERAQA